MKKIIVFIVLFTFSIFASSIKDATENKIKNKYPISEVKFEKFKIPADVKSDIEKSVKQKFFRSEVYLWQIMDKDTLTSLILLDNVYGKTMPITFMVEFNSAGIITSSEIVKYREDHGGEVSQKWWQDQFLGKTSSDKFIVGHDVDGITGATISSNSVSKGVKKLTLLAYRILYAEN